MPTAGFWITSTAPYSSARSTVSAPFFGQRRADQNRNRLVGHDLLQERQPVHVRHLDVEHDHVGPALLHLAHRDQRVGRGVHVDPHLARQHGGHHLPHHGGVVHDEHVHVLAAGISLTWARLGSSANQTATACAPLASWTRAYDVGTDAHRAGR